MRLHNKKKFKIVTFTLSFVFIFISIIYLFFGTAIKIEYYWWRAKKSLTSGGESIEIFADKLDKIGAKVFPVIYDKLKSPDDTDRETAVLILKYLENKDSTLILIKSLLREKELSVKKLMVEVLGVIGDKAAIGILRKELAKSPPEILQSDIVISLARLRERTSIPYLINILNKGEAYYEKSITDVKNIYDGHTRIVKANIYYRTHIFDESFRQLRDLLGPVFKYNRNGTLQQQQNDLKTLEHWWKENKDYLYWSEKDVHFVVDEEAKTAGIPTEEYRKTHPWPKDIKSD